MKVKLALAQINTKLGVVESNLEKHLDYIQRAKNEGADLIIFLGTVPDRLRAAGPWCPPWRTRATSDDPVFKELLAASRDIDIVVGFAEEDVRNRFYISSAYLSLGKVAHVHRKVIPAPLMACSTKGAFSPGAYSVEAFDTRFWARRHPDL